DLVGVTRQRDLAWLNCWIREPDRMLAEKDPLALALFERFDKIPMPNLRLDENAAQSILGFLQEETDRQQPLQAARVP
ncbi:MAG: electron transporter SenC, partial [Pseudomonas mandelii]